MSDEKSGTRSSVGLLDIASHVPGLLMDLPIILSGVITGFGARPTAKTSIGKVFQDRAVRYGDKMFIKFGDEQITYREANETVNRYAAVLAARGVGHGDVVGIMLRNSPQSVLLMLAAVKCGAIAGMLPFLIVSSRCAKHQKLVEDQLPEALDFLSRVLRAGHSLATGLQMAADEIPVPLADEFRRCYDQHSLGATLEQSMKEMAERVGTPDFSFFVTAVLIQRTTGGDLAEVLTNIGNMVRARIRLQQHVKAVTAQGRMVGYILLVLPVVFYIITYLLNPKYARVLIDTQQYPEGIVVLSIAATLQVIGLISIRKIVSVKM